jgi:hypothetical protein
MMALRQIAAGVMIKSGQETVMITEVRRVANLDTGTEIGRGVTDTWAEMIEGEVEAEAPGKETGTGLPMSVARVIKALMTDTRSTLEWRGRHIWIDTAHQSSLPGRNLTLKNSSLLLTATPLVVD